MRLNSKKYYGALCLLFVALIPGRAQDTTSVAKAKNTDQLQIYVAGILPKALGNNFLNKAYDVKAGLSTEFLVLFGQHYFMGYQAVFNGADVNNPGLVGQFNRSNIQHHFVKGGYSFYPKENNLGLMFGVGAGFARYKNYRDKIKFKDTGFSVMVNTTLNYRLSSLLGVAAGVQLSNDFMNIDTAPEVDSFFNNARSLHYSLGLVIYVKERSFRNKEGKPPSH